jgi:transposase InsO family protein
VLVELGLLEQRHKAVLEVMNGAVVTDVARRYGVARQTLHDWLRRYAKGGMAALSDRNSRPATCPHQMPPEIEARVCALRREHPAWGPQTILYSLAKEQVTPLPSRSAVYRALVRHSLIEPTKRRRQRGDYKRWERSRPMELWQMDVVGGVKLTDGSECSVVTGLDDHSRFCVSAKVVARATARPVCDALAEAMRRHGVPENLLTDNGKVFTGRFGVNPSGEVLFDRICRENGIRHLLTAPYSPTTTGKVERFHKTLRAGCLTGEVFASIEAAQAAIDTWVGTYNTERPHQSTGGVPPAKRFALAKPADAAPYAEAKPAKPTPAPEIGKGLGITRWVDQSGRIGLGGFKYHIGKWLAGEIGGDPRSRRLALNRASRRAGGHPRPALPGGQLRHHPPRPQRPQASPSHFRHDGHAHRGCQRLRQLRRRRLPRRAGTRRQGRTRSASSVSVQLAVAGRVVRIHPARHDPAKEHGAFAPPKGRPRKNKVSPSDPSLK